MHYPHVTEVLRPFADYSHVPEEALRRGQDRHRSYAAHLMGLWAPSLLPDDHGSLESFKRWSDKYVRNVILVEQSLIDTSNGYQGTIDFIGNIQTNSEDFLAVLDWKPYSSSGPIIRAQVSAYLNLAGKNSLAVKKGGFLRIDPDGGIPKMEWIEAGNNDLAGFLAALSAYRYFKS